MTPPEEHVDDNLPLGLPKAGDVVAEKYRVERVIGRGAMGVVYAAQHELLRQRVALKLLLPEVAADDEAVRRFINEARAAARIKDEHVAGVMDVGKTDAGVVYMVLEYLDGKDLGEVLAERGKLPQTEVVDYVLQALVAIAEAHGAGIVHRDLKPGNLFLTQKGGQPHVKVLDFGISKVQGNSPHSRSLTKTSALLGSPGYMSPEQVRSAKYVDARSDIWSIGVILYRLLTDTPPFDGETVGAVFAAILEQSPQPVRALVPEVSPELDRVVLRCLERKPDARWQSVAELAAALAPLASEDGARSAERVSRAPRPISTPPPQEAPKLVTPVRPVAPPPPSPNPVRSERRIERPARLSPPPPPPPKSFPVPPLVLALVLGVVSCVVVYLLLRR